MLVWPVYKWNLDQNNNIYELCVKGMVIIRECDEVIQDARTFVGTGFATVCHTNGNANGLVARTCAIVAEKWWWLMQVQSEQVDYEETVEVVWDHNTSSVAKTLQIYFIKSWTNTRGFTYRGGCGNTFVTFPTFSDHVGRILLQCFTHIQIYNLEMCFYNSLYLI